MSQVSSMWGSKDGRILATGHYAQKSVEIWCLCTGQLLRTVQCNGKVKSMSGFGRLVGDKNDPLTIVVAYEASVSHKTGSLPLFPLS